MKERPILFSTDMVKAILVGRKIMTRRVIKGKELDALVSGIYSMGELAKYHCPYGKVGDRLWLRERYRVFSSSDECSHYESCNCYKYDGKPIYYADQLDNESKWKPSIFMPRKFSRITLEISDTKVERVQQITHEDAVREGCYSAKELVLHEKVCDTASVHHFANLWDSINAKRGYSWASNPWVWVISFKVLTK